MMKKITIVLFISTLSLNSCNQVKNTNQIENQKINSLSQNNSNLSEKEISKVVFNIFKEDPEYKSKTNSYNSTGSSLSDNLQVRMPVSYFVSAIASLVYQRPNDLKKMVKKNNDGSYTVTFPGLPSKSKVILVKAPTNQELNKFVLKGNNNVLLATVMIKAITKYWSENGFFRFFRSKSKAANYGFSWEGIEIITGKKSKSIYSGHSGNTSEKNNIKFLDLLENTLNSKKLVTVSSGLSGHEWSFDKNDVYIGTNMVYTVVKVDKASRKITLRNPYGYVARIKELKKNSYNWEKEYKNDGLFTLNLARFQNYFGRISIETDTNVTSANRFKYLK